jgi:hypothetical protein
MDAGTYHLSYLEVPLLARAALPLPGKLEYHAMMGPALGILLEADLALTDGRHIDLAERFERLDIGLLLGAAAAIDIRDQGEVTLDIRYNFGLRKVDKVSTGENDDAMNRAFYFTVGYRANLDDLLHSFRGEAAPPPPQVLPSSD